MIGQLLGIWKGIRVAGKLSGLLLILHRVLVWLIIGFGLATGQISPRDLPEVALDAVAEEVDVP